MGEEKKTFKQNRIEMLKHAQKTAQIILERYPVKVDDPTYLHALVQAISQYPINVQEALGDLRHGITGTVKQLPTAADVFEIGDRLWKTIGDKPADQKPKVFVQKGTDAWIAWQKLSSTPNISRVDEFGCRIEGWYFETEYPDK